jgi:transcriptional regulator with XRE-family HTH domain
VEISDEKTFLVAFGKHLQKVRLDKGFTQAQLAIDLGVEISQISRIERGVINTSIGNINAIAKILKVPVSELFEFD